MTLERRPRLLVLTTGGTIVSARKNGRKHYPEGGTEIVHIVAGLAPEAELTIEEICAIGSQDISLIEWRAIERRIAHAIESAEFEGIVVTHGTDTMEETAFLLDCLFPSGPPIVLTGALQPPDAPDTDGPFNLACAIKVACCPDSRGRGTLVVMDGHVHAAQLVRKAAMEGKHTFVSDGSGPLGRVDVHGVQFHQCASDPVVQSALFLPTDASLPHVELLMVAADIAPATLQWWARTDAAAIVVVGMANGNLPANAISTLASFARQGQPVVRTSLIGGEQVMPGGEVDDATAGFIPAGLLTPGKARLKLQLLIANGYTTESLKQAFSPKELVMHHDGWCGSVRLKLPG